MDVPTDILQEELWKYLSIDEIHKYCTMNKDMYNVYSDPDTWRYLLYRDFSIVSATQDPKKEYMRETEFERRVQDVMSIPSEESYSIVDMIASSYVDEYSRYIHLFMQERDRLMNLNETHDRLRELCHVFRRGYLINLLRKSMH